MCDLIPTTFPRHEPYTKPFARHIHNHTKSRSLRSGFRVLFANYGGGWFIRLEQLATQYAS